MKRFLYLSILLLVICKANAQKISFSSNGKVNNFQKIDSLFLTEFTGQKPLSRNDKVDSSISISLLQFDSSFGVISKTLEETNFEEGSFSNNKKLLTTSFYVYSDGTLQAPTSVLFFKPFQSIEVFSAFGTVVSHPNFEGYYYLHLNTFIYNDGDKIFALCDSLFGTNTVSTIEPVFVRRIKVESDPLFPNEWNITNNGQFNGSQGADMKVANAWNMGYTGMGVKVAVIDLGVDLQHEDLKNNLLPGYDATGNNSGGGPVYNSYNTHGTNCSGIIAEEKNDKGGVGIAYNAKIIPIRFAIGYLNQSSGQINLMTNDTWQANCFVYATNNGADIISNSWGGGSKSIQLDLAIQSAVSNGRGGKGSIVLFSAGNNNSVVSYPATNNNVIAVGASSECDTRKRSSSDPLFVNPGVSTDPLDVSCDDEYWWGSNYGNNLDIMAPGVHITTTTLPSGNDYTNAYMNHFNGTSAACPNAAGVVALMLSANPNLTGKQARDILETTCDKVGGYTYYQNVSGQPNGTWCADAGYGRVNACSAVSRAVELGLSILGPTSLCGKAGSGVFSIPNLPANANVTWKASPSWVVTLTPSGNNVIVTRTGNSTVTLTATISNLCTQVPVSLSTKIIVGTPTITTFFSTAPVYVKNYGGYYAAGINLAGTDPDVSHYRWKVNGILQSTTWGRLTLPTNCAAGELWRFYSITVAPINACGSGFENCMIYRYDCNKNTMTAYKSCANYSTLASRNATTRFVLTQDPNLQNQLLVSVATTTDDEFSKLFFEANNLGDELVQSVRVYDLDGNLLIESSNIGDKQTNIDLSSLSEGAYNVEISGNNDYKEQQTYSYTVTKTEQTIAEDIAIGNVDLSATDSTDRKEVLQQQLYKLLKGREDLRLNSVTLSNFFVIKGLENFGVINKLNEVLSTYDVTTAQAILADWQPTNRQDSNCYQYYTYFISYLNGDNFNFQDLYDLYDLANRCPQTDGEIIFAARSLYNYIAQDNEEFAFACNVFGLRQAKKKPDVIVVTKGKSQPQIILGSTRIFPNPSTGLFKIQFPTNTKGVNTILVMDGLGKVVLQQSVIAGVQTVSFSKSLPKGLYLVNIQNSVSGKTETQKLIVE